MSDDLKNKNLPGNEPEVKGGWHLPSEPSLWQEPDAQDEDSQPFSFWKPMPAFPEDVAEEPEEQGLWHRPSPEDTILTEETEIIKGQPIVVEQEEEPEPAGDGALSPEDMIAQILGTKPESKASDAPLAAPEDFQIPTKEPADDSIPSPEDLDLGAIQDAAEAEEEIVEDIIEDTLDDLDEMDDEPFDSAELAALEQMIEAEATGEDLVADAEDSISDLVEDVQDGLGDPLQAEDEAEQEAPPSDAASYAEQMLRQLESEDNETVNLAEEPDATSVLDDDENSLMGGLFSGTADLGERADTATATAEDPAEAARRALAALDDEGTGSSVNFSTAPLPQQQQTAYIDPQTREYAEAFRNTQNQVATLTAMYNNENMTYDEYQRLLYENMVQDENGIWWMIGANSDTWYRHNVETNGWEEDYPPALMALEQYEQALNPPSASSAVTAYDLPPIDNSPPQPVTPQAGDTRYDNLGVPIGTVPEQIDNNYTMVGDSAFAQELPDQQVTIPSDAGGFEPTVLSPSVQDPSFAETMPMESRAQGFGDDPISSAVDSSVPSDFSQMDDFAPTVQAVKQEQQNNLVRTLIFAVVGVGALGLIVVIGVAVLMMLWYNSSVEPYRDGVAALASYDPPFQTARILDANGDLIVELNSSETGARTAIPLDEMSPFIVHAIVSQENERFYEDPGFDPIAIARAFTQNIFGGEIESGASTITQQIARNLVLQDTEVTSERKINEILVALEIANQYDKNFILELYLNEVFFGNQSYGVEAASQFYFGHGADELNFAESALLASIVPSPALNDPVVNRPTAITGMRSTMRKMLEVSCLQFQHGDWVTRGEFCVTPDTLVDFEGDSVGLVRVNSNGEITGGLATLQIAEIETAEYQPRNVRLKYPHFVNYIQSEIEAEYGTNALFQRGFTIYTTLNPSVQESAQDTLTRQVEVLVDTGVNTGAVMVTDPNTGAIRAMVGSHDFSDEIAGQVNNALTFQQPGSSIKPIVYTAGLIGNQGTYLTPASILWDVPVTYDVNGVTYTPVNFDRRFHGPTPLRFALQNSYNVAAVKAYVTVGNDKFVETSQAMGLIFPEGSQVGPASALGANEVRLYDMMEAYGIFANAGQKVELYAIDRITETVDGQDVEVPRPPRPEAIQAISPQVAYLMQNILSDDNARAEQFGTNSNLTLARLGVPSQNRVSAKTGTSNDSRDLWTMGFTRNVVVGVWLGTYDNSPTFGTTGFNSASPVWNAVMEAALRGRTPPEIANPGGVVAREICRTTGTLSFDTCPQRTTDVFIQDKFPPSPDQGFVQTIAIDSWSGLRANDFCDDYIVQDTFADINDPSAVDWLNTTNEGRAYAQTVGLPIPLQAPPTSSCSQGQALPTVIVSAPNPNSNVQGQVAIRGQVQAPDFARYELAYASAVQPDTFFPISTSQNQVTSNGSELGTWDTLQLVNGNYILRLTVLSNTGGAIVVDIPVLVDNPVPTATPVPLPTSTPLDTNSSSAVTAGTAIPFPNATASSGQ